VHAFVTNSRRTPWDPNFLDGSHGPFEGLDNTGTTQLVLGSEPRFRSEHRAELLGGVTVIRGVTVDGKAFLAIPFYALANREASTQEVWAVQRGLKASTEWWLGALSRPPPLSASQRQRQRNEAWSRLGTRGSGSDFASIPAPARYGPVTVRQLRNWGCIVLGMRVLLKVMRMAVI
jgi:hypothetical protein